MTIQPPSSASQSGASQSGASNSAPSQQSRCDRTAYDIESLHDQLLNLSSVEMRQVPVLNEGSPLKADAVYINLNDVKRREFNGVEGMTVNPGTYIIPKDDVCYDLWNRLTNVG